METQEQHALIIIDLWDRYWPGYTRFQNIIEQTENRINKLLPGFKHPVILSSYNTYKNELGKYVKQDITEPWTRPSISVENCVLNHKYPNLISWNFDEVNDFLKKQNITTLIYAGASLPGCIENRELGLLNMSKEYKCKILIDCVIDFTSNGYNDYEIIHDAYRHAIKKNYELITSDTLHLS